MSCDVVYIFNCNKCGLRLETQAVAIPPGWILKQMGMTDTQFTPIHYYCSPKCEKTHTEFYGYSGNPEAESEKKEARWRLIRKNK